MTCVKGNFKVPFLRTPYNYDIELVSDETGLKCEDPSLTQQHFKDECDINLMLERWVQTGEIPNFGRQPQYGDFTEVGDYQMNLNRIIAARRSYELLPKDIRKRFTSPEELLNFLSDPLNEAEAIKLGLLAGTTPSDTSKNEQVSENSTKSETVGI